MTLATLEIADLRDLLRRPITDAKVVAAFGSRLADLERSGDFGYIHLRRDGVEVTLGEAARVIPEEKITDPALLHICAFHLHRAGHEGYAGYPGKLPHGVLLGEPEWSALRKMGEPTWSGGGTVDSANVWTPYWIRYRIGSNVLHFQSDRSGCIDMATLMAPDIRREVPAKRQRVVIVSVPSRAALLWSREREKGTPLVEQEVAEICGNSAAVALPLMSAAAIEESRGYRDIDGDHCWEEWQRARAELIEHDGSSRDSD